MNSYVLYYIIEKSGFNAVSAYLLRHNVSVVIPHPSFFLVFSCIYIVLSFGFINSLLNPPLQFTQLTVEAHGPVLFLFQLSCVCIDVSVSFLPVKNIFVYLNCSLCL